MRVRASIALVLLAACAPSPASSDGPDSGASSPEGATSAASASQADAAPPSEASPGTGPSDAGDAAFAPFSPDGQVPSSHRASDEACSPRGPGQSCAGDAMAAPGNACVTDSDCTMGKNGRCFDLPLLIPPEAGSDHGTLQCSAFCSYDACQTDSDCPARVPCDCHTPDVAGAPNTCLTASNCAVDSDCGPGGFCSPSGAPAAAGQSTLAYYCHTPGDSCFSDTDCPPPPGPGTESCAYDSAAARWDCHYIPTTQ